MTKYSRFTSKVLEIFQNEAAVFYSQRRVSSWHDKVSLKAMDQKKFNDIKQAYGDVASWALWSDTNDGDTSDVSILEAG